MMREPITKNCEVCGKEFTTVQPYHIYCSKKCSKKNDNMRRKMRKIEQETHANCVNAELIRINRLALEEGLSYGKYVQKHGL